MSVPALAAPAASAALALPSRRALRARARWLGTRVLLALAMWVPVELIYMHVASFRTPAGLTLGRFYGFLANVGVSCVVAVFTFWAVERWPLWGVRRRLAHWGTHLGMAGTALLFLGLTSPILTAWAGFPPEPRGAMWLRLVPGTLFIYAVASSVGTCFAARGEWTEAALRRTSLAAQLHQAQLSVLRSQLHPHFLFNTLNALAELVHNDRDGAVRVVRQLGTLLRYSMDASGETEVPLRDEMAALQAYLDIVRVRFGDRATITADVEPGAMDVRVPPLLLQPLVENAVKHGFERMEGGGWMEVTGRVRGGRLRLQVANGSAGAASAEGGRIGIGIRNTRARLEQLYGAGAELTLRDAGGRFTATVTLPAR